MFFGSNDVKRTMQQPLRVDASIGGCVEFQPKIFQKYIKYEDIIAKVGLASASLTLVATLSIIVFILYKRIFSNIQVKPLLYLSIADFCLAFAWVTASARYLEKNDVEDTQQTPLACFIWQLVTEVIHMMTFCFTINYSINVYFLMKDRVRKMGMDYTEQVHEMGSRSAMRLERFKALLYYISWALPILLMTPIYVNINYQYISACQKCVIAIDVPRLVGPVSVGIQAYGFIILAVTLFLSMIVIVTLYGLTLRLYWQAIPAYHTDRQRRQLLNMQKRISVYVFVFMLCWIPALILAGLKSKETLQQDEENKIDLIDYFWLYVLQAFLTPLQGFFNTIVYGWSRRSFREAIRQSITPSTQLYVPTPEFSSAYYDNIADYTVENDPESEDVRETDLKSNSSSRPATPFLSY